jgi:glycosyltransferase involved in cell wall biosynthesis
MPTFNRGHYLPLSVGALLNQDEVREVIVVDDCSSDASEELIAQMRTRDSRVRSIRNMRRKGSATSRNLGLEAASGEFVLMLDDDIVMDTGSLSVLCSHREAHQMDAISCRVILLRSGESPGNFSPRAPISTLVKRGTLDVSFECHTGADIPTVLSPGVMLFRRESLRGLRYDANLRGGAWREETDFQVQYARAGMKMIYCPHAVAFHLPPRGGGQRSIGRLQYEVSIFKNNRYFSGKHGAYLRTVFPDLRWIGRPFAWALAYELERARMYAGRFFKRLWKV